MGFIVLVLVLTVGRCAFRPPRVVFVVQALCLYNTFSHFWPAGTVGSFSSKPLSPKKRKPAGASRTSLAAGRGLSAP